MPNTRSTRISKTITKLHAESYQLTTRQDCTITMSQPSISPCIAEVTDVIYSHLLDNYCEKKDQE